jgi:hypothetical protein
LILTQDPFGFSNAEDLSLNDGLGRHKKPAVCHRKTERKNENPNHLIFYFKLDSEFIGFLNLNYNNYSINSAVSRFNNRSVNFNELII